MQYDGFVLTAFPQVVDAYCKADGAALVEVSDGFLSRAMFCPKCEGVYKLKLIKVPSTKVSAEWLEQARKEIKRP